jgi:hypothetical protein
MAAKSGADPAPPLDAHEIRLLDGSNAHRPDPGMVVVAGAGFGAVGPRGGVGGSVSLGAAFTGACAVAAGAAGSGAALLDELDGCADAAAGSETAERSDAGAVFAGPFTPTGTLLVVLAASLLAASLLAADPAACGPGRISGRISTAIPITRSVEISATPTAIRGSNARRRGVGARLGATSRTGSAGVVMPPGVACVASRTGGGG